ncbi:rod shape-determining protein MreC [Kerstersia gyiorum]|uniref:Cell shape-determining protein MreC n=1 Tax=Kerstersia gyiorum TaxID=206506 RepID=A0A171KWE1_9BURK|nr:rod shape-determining protein MreC [Kerstersia gyiorum]KKO73208.1 rod shape-determining protein MreC [Kerstersia gyiorum]
MQHAPAPRLFKHAPSLETRMIALALLALALLVADAQWRPALEPVRQGLSLAIYPFQRAVLLPRDLVRSVNDWLNAAALVRSENELLQRQRIELAQISTHAAQLAAENAQLRRLLGVGDRPAGRGAVVVQVMYEPLSVYNRRLVFDKGASSGIAAGMPVIDEGGVVGQIVRTTPMTSEAALLTDEGVSIPVQSLRNGLRLIAFGGKSPGKVEVRYLSADDDITEGDILVTSGLGGFFPAGLPVARIERVERDTESGFASAVGEPLSHPERYRHFLVLLDGEAAAQPDGATPEETP